MISEARDGGSSTYAQAPAPLGCKQLEIPAAVDRQQQI